jgi:hypothetical protein
LSFLQKIKYNYNCFFFPLVIVLEKKFNVKFGYYYIKAM